MVDPGRRVAAETENVEITLKELESAIGRQERTAVELAAIATFVHNTYNGIENILGQILRARGVEVPRREAWHKQLLDRAVSSGVLSQSLADELLEYLTFRHFFVHGYGVLLEETPLTDLATRLPDVWARFRSEIDRSLK
jgi:uncharacterized protein YutE (UPF0331/DUF86 family)